MELPEAASGTSRRELERLVADLSPPPPAPDSTRRLPGQETSGGRGDGARRFEPEPTDALAPSPRRPPLRLPPRGGRRSHRWERPRGAHLASRRRSALGSVSSDALGGPAPSGAPRAVAPTRAPSRRVSGAATRPGDSCLAGQSSRFVTVT